MWLAPRKLSIDYSTFPDFRSFDNGKGRANRSVNSSRHVPTCSVPRDRGVRGAARGLERELKAPGRHTKTHSSKKLYHIYRYHLDMQDSRIQMLTGLLELSFLTGAHTEHEK